MKPHIGSEVNCEFIFSRVVTIMVHLLGLGEALFEWHTEKLFICGRIFICIEFWGQIITTFLFFQGGGGGSEKELYCYRFIILAERKKMATKLSEI